MEPQNDSIEEKVTTRSLGMKYGLFLTVFTILSFLVTTISGINVQDGMGAWVNRLVSIVATLVLFYLAQQNFKQSGDGYMSYGQGLGIGFWTSLVSSVISSLFIYVYVKFIDSGFIDMIKDKQQEAMQARGMSDEQIAQAMKYAAMFTSPEAILIFGLVFGLLFGVILAVLLTIFTQKNNPDTSI
jgi:hypothetical protein